MDDRTVATEEPLTHGQAPARSGWADRLLRWLRPRRRWCLGTRLVVTATAGWLMFVVLHRLVSGRSWLWAPLDLIPPLLFAAVPVVLLAVAVFARPVRWRVMVVLLVTGLLGAGASGINLSSVWYNAPPAPPSAITVVSWNTEFWDQDWRTAGGTAYETGFYDYLRTLDADVYLLTEYLYVDTSAAELALRWTPDLALRIDKLPRLRRELPDYQVAMSGEQITLSRLPIVGQRGLDLRPWLPEDLREVPPALQNWPESYTTETLRTDIRVGEETVSVYNGQINQPPLEWQLFRREARDANRYSHARRTASYQALSEDIVGNEHPVVLAADLNTSPAMGMRHRLPEALVDHTRALPSIYPVSWLAGSLELWRLDWLLTTPDVAVHRYELLEDAGLSDHRPQLTVLSVEGT